MKTTKSRRGRGAAPRPLRLLGIVGYDAIEPVILAALAEEAPLLLVGAHGTAKSLLLNRIAAALGLRHRHYNASLLSFDDLVGFPVPSEDRRTLHYIQTPATIWGAESVFLDEISRCRPELQNKLFPIIHERVVQGIALDALRFRWSAMNPPADEEAAEEQAYRGSEPLDPALADRFPFIVPVPELPELSAEDRRALFSGAAEQVDPAASARLWEAVDAVRAEIPRVTARLGEAAAEYVEALAPKLEKMRRPVSPRRARMLVRGFLAVHAACRVLAGDRARPGDSALLALRCSMPHAPAGLPVDNAKLLAAHRGAWELIRLESDDPARLVLAEPDPVRRLGLALEHRLEPLQLSTVAMDVLAGLEPWRRRALGAVLFARACQDVELTAAAYDTIAAEALQAVGFADTRYSFRPGSNEHERWKDVVAMLAALPAGLPGADLLHNVAMSLLAEEIPFPVHELVPEWTRLLKALGAPAGGDSCGA
jgi:MoxR-like ATPase